MRKHQLGTLGQGIACALALVVLCASLPGAAVAEDALARVKREGILHVANSGVYPPFESVADGKVVGFDVDLSNMLAAELGVKADIRVIDFKGLIPSLKSGKVDALVTAMTYTPERAEQVGFSIPYYRTALVVATLPGARAITSKADLAGLRLGAEIGTTGDREIHAIPGAAATKTYDSLMLALTDLQNKRLDAVISTLPPTQYLIHNAFHKVQIAYRYDQGYVAVNTRKEDHQLLAAINQALEKFVKDGRLRALQIKWFGAASL